MRAENRPYRIQFFEKKFQSKVSQTQARKNKVSKD